MTAIFRDDQYFPVQGVYGSTWRGDVTVAGGGCLIEHSIHDLDILRFCLGDVTEVTGRTANFSGHEGVEDLAAVSLQFASGASAQLVSVWHDILSRGLDAPRRGVLPGAGWRGSTTTFSGPCTSRPRPAPRSVPARRRGGCATWPSVTTTSAWPSAPTSRPIAPFSTPWPPAATPEPSFAEAVVAHRLVDAAYRSSGAGGTPVVLG